ncbi:tetratricopeptide repeat protein [Phenylobacterium sp.]|uniref:tetratricopeptide repeat protein n=1 Tax=Phenylobacterium sp. TaxID=1871053 RepID=UPI00286D7A53|nr:tetratricopeptide repeat protein [Phenylobacterium sp.]
MVDVFEEVEEQLRTDRYKALALKALPWVGAALAGALLIALAVWGYDAYQTKTTSKASEQYAQALEAFGAGRADEADRLFGEVAKSGSKAYKSLALQHQGGIKIAAGKPAEAVKYFDEAAEAAPNEIIGDVARLKSAFALLDTAPYKDLEARLTPMTKEGRPYRTEAREALAFAKILHGDLAGARGDFVVISLIADASEGARNRAKAAMDLIDSGSAKNVAAAARAAAALPPQSPLLPPGASAGLSAPTQQPTPDAQ